MRASSRVKNRVFAAGPTSNIVLAAIAGILLSTLFVGPMAIANDGQGVVVGSIEPGSGAEMAGLQNGDVLTKIAGAAIHNRTEYTTLLAGTRAGDRVDIEYVRDGATRTTTAVLGDRYDYIQKVAPEQNTEENRGKGFLGVSAVGLDGLDDIRDALAHPFGSLGNFFFYLSYPFFIFTQGVDVLNDPYSGLFTIHGPLAALPAPVFFGIATLLYWIVWLNLMLGTFNALPAGPLDGGQMFRATLSDRLMRRHKVDPARLEVERLEMGGLQLKGKDEETQAKLDRVNVTVGRAVRTLGYFILALILLPVFAPPIIRLFT